MCRLVLFLFFIDLAAVCVDAQPSLDSNSHLARSACFEVESFASSVSPKSVLTLCEKLRTELLEVWGGMETPPSWEPRCRVRVHADRTSYQLKVGANGGQTSGSSLIQVASGKIIQRDIDLLINADGELSALPHELTHIVLADKFQGRQPPHWIDEGIAMLADTVSKQNLHARDCHEAIVTGRAMTVRQIVALDTFSSPSQMPAFYGQSLSLVRMLAEQASPEKVVDFANDSLDRGFETALKLHYGFDGIDELEKSWKNYVFHKSNLESRMAIVSVSFKP